MGAPHMKGPTYQLFSLVAMEGQIQVSIFPRKQFDEIRTSLARTWCFKLSVPKLLNGPAVTQTKPLLIFKSR